MNVAVSSEPDAAGRERRCVLQVSRTGVWGAIVVRTRNEPEKTYTGIALFLPAVQVCDSYYMMPDV